MMHLSACFGNLTYIYYLQLTFLLQSVIANIVKTSMFAADSSSERATSIEDYQNTCAEFITDISRDYKDWVDRYDLSTQETLSRKSIIDDIVKNTNDWIFKYADTIKKVDIVMNDGVSKMAENTAGYPYNFQVTVNNMSRYAWHSIGMIKLNVKAVPRDGRLARIGHYRKDEVLLINSVCPVNFTISKESVKAADILDDYIIIDCTSCQKLDLLSVTVVSEEISKEDYVVTESRGYSTLIALA